MRISVILSLAVGVGLVLSGLIGTEVPLAGVAIAILGGGLGLVLGMPRLWRTGPRAKTWAIATLVTLVAVGYGQVRTPQPDAMDISQWVTTQSSQPVQVWGRIMDEPRLTRSQSVRFWLQTMEAARDQDQPEARRGKLYVTVPLLEGTALHLGQEVAIAGTLYRPQPAQIPGGFDFRAYLARQGSFAGLRGSTVDPLAARRYPISALELGLTGLRQRLQTVRQRIIQAHVEGLGRGGLLVSSMVLGRRAVDLPYDLYDQFAQAGMAHTLAASGFHVSLLLGLVLTVSYGFTPRRQLAIATAVLLVYLGLTGLHPSVLRASVMGLAALLGLAAQRPVNSLRSLLTAATLLLIINPLWIWDLGFQFSFLATLGLVVTAGAITKRLDWMPPNPASAIAIPLAALIWTIPIQLYSFGIMPVYSIGVNIVLTPLVWITSMGGMVTGAIALIHPKLGAVVTPLLHWGVEGLIHSVAWVTQQPGARYAIGSVALWQVLALYTILGLVWMRPGWQRRWWAAALGALALVLIPATYAQATQLHITRLPGPAMVVVWHYRGQVGIINSGSDRDLSYTILPFLTQQGINRLDWAIALDPLSDESGWLRLLQTLPTGTLLYQTPPENAPLITHLIQSRSINAQPLASSNALGSAHFDRQAEGAIARLCLDAHCWLMLNQPDTLMGNQALQAMAAPEVLTWTGALTQPSLLAQIQPRQIVAPGFDLDPALAPWISEGDHPYALVGRDGAVQWTPAGLQAARATQD
jgi:competence protein ComEC